MWLARSIEGDRIQNAFSGTYVSMSANYLHSWDISPDGKRFLTMGQAAPSGDKPAAESPRRINTILNWTEELKQHVPVKMEIGETLA